MFVGEGHFRLRGEEVGHHGWALRRGYGHFLDVAVGPGQPSAVLAEVLLAIARATTVWKTCCR